MRKALFILALLTVTILPIASADSFEEFAVTGNFLAGIPCLTNSDAGVMCPFGGGFIVDETTGQVVLVDLFHGATQFNILGSPFLDTSFYTIIAFDSIGDELQVVLPVSSLIGYTGGPIGDADVLTSVSDGFCAPNECSNHLRPLPGANSAIDSGPVPNPIPEPEPASGVLVLIGFAPLIALRKRLNLRLFGTDLRSTN